MDSLTLFLEGRGLTVIKYKMLVHDELAIIAEDVLGNEVPLTDVQAAHVAAVLLASFATKIEYNLKTYSK